MNIIPDYAARKASGNVTLQRNEGRIELCQKRYHPDTGQELAPVIDPVNAAWLTAEKTRLQNQITEIDALIADINSLP